MKKKTPSPDENSSSKTVSLKLAPALEKRLATTAYRQGVSKSSLIREAVAQYLDTGMNDQESTFRARAGELIGAVKGPADLSTNPDHLADFGK